eukprot:s534_g14.t1
MVYNATQSESELVAAHVASSLSHTWFLVPNGAQIRAPKTGTRPGDPSADILFGFVMAQMLSQIRERADQVGISMVLECEYGTTTNYVGWVDDLALSVMTDADKVVSQTKQLASLVIDVMTEHGMRLSCGRGKTAVMFEFHGVRAIKAKQHFEQHSADSVSVMSEHLGAMTIPVTGFYKHLGGLIIPNGSRLQEIKARGAALRQNIAPLKSILSNKRFDLKHRRMLMKTLGLSVIRLHSGIWFDLNQTEIEAWSSVVYNAYHLLERRQADGLVAHKQLYELSLQMGAPMPVEFLYIERLRLIVHLLQVLDKHAITAILQNYHLAGKRSWLYGAIKSVQWAQMQIGRESVPDELIDLGKWETWTLFHEVAVDVKKIIKEVERAHQLRLQTYCTLKEHAEFQAGIFQEMGWVKSVPTQPEEVTTATCPECSESFSSQATLAVHQQRRHHQRVALRRFVRDGVCRGCHKQFHQRTRLLSHVHWGRGLCWAFHFRSFVPMNDEEVAALDEQDRINGQAYHQRGVVHDQIPQTWRWATEQELQPTLPLTGQTDHLWEDPVTYELEEWATLGLLPPGKGGRAVTQRQCREWELNNVCRDISKMEEKLKDEVRRWTPNFDWVPRALSQGQLFFLVLFSGHRRWGDISSHFHWDGRIMPVALDLAVDGTHGNLLNHQPILNLIRSRRVVGAHGGPPCETYSVARWRSIPGICHPRPLRDQQFPWGRLYLSLLELLQCQVGTELMLVTMKILLEVYAAGGSISLEHPRGDLESDERWCIWLSSFMKWILLGPDLQTCTFLQGPLGQCAPKPTTMLIGRLPGFAKMVFQNYSKKWKAKGYLDGWDAAEKSWKTAKAKVYPPLLSQIIFQAHMAHAVGVPREGEEPIPTESAPMLEALTRIHDPYEVEAFQQMQADFHGSRRGSRTSSKRGSRHSSRTGRSSSKKLLTASSLPAFKSHFDAPEGGICCLSHEQREGLQKEKDMILKSCGQSRVFTFV